MLEERLCPAHEVGMAGQMQADIEAPLRPTVGLFDSGVGGLSVLRALRREMPGADYVYFGDTARLPYGKRSPETIIGYSLQASRFLISCGADALVIACNTASSVAQGALRQAFPNTQVAGVVEAGARAAADVSHTGRIAILGTECTVHSGAYERAITRHRPSAVVQAMACPFLVSLAEEGWTDCDVAFMAVKRYLTPLLKRFGSGKPDCIVLGCTHFSRFCSVIRSLVGPDVKLIDPADHLAAELKTTFQLSTTDNAGSVAFHATDALLRFSRVGSRFLGNEISRDHLERVELDNL